MKMNCFFVIIMVILLVPAISHAQYPGQNKNKLGAKIEAPMKVYSFDLHDVRLLNSSFKANMGRDAQWLLSIGANRLLHNFRVNAGMELLPNIKPLGGWESMDSELRGHITGHAMSALALLYASTGDSLYKREGDSVVAGLAEVQKVLNQGGYLSAFPQHLIDRCIAGKSVWAPWYTLHKIMAGLIDMYWYANNQQALAVAEKMASWAYQKVSPLTPDQRAGMLKNEYGGMNEALYNLYAITGNKQDLNLAEMFYSKNLMNSLAEGEDALSGLHANTQIPKVIGEARGHELTDSTEFKEISIFFWNTVINTQTYATGGNSDREHFVAPGELSKHLTGYTQETCNTYNMLKLSRHLFCWSANEKYMDYYEQALYNDILPQQDPETGMICYFTPLEAGVFKLYSTPYRSFWCDVGTGFENHAKYGESIYYHNNTGVYVCLFIPSILKWKERGIKIIQETRYPEEPNTTLTIICDSALQMPLYIRYPSWATSGAIIKVNGEKINIHQDPGSFITLNRKWKSGDKVEIMYPMSLRLVPTPDNPKVAAVDYGPLVLSAKVGFKGIVPPAPFSDPNKHNDYYTYNYHIPRNIPDTLLTKGNEITDWIKPLAHSKEIFFTAKDARGKDITLIPFNEIHRGRYVVYWNLK